MVLSTSQLRAAYGPRCNAKDWGMEAAYKALDIVLQYFFYVPRSEDTGSYNCRPITGGSEYSLHAYRDDGVYIFWSGVKVVMALAVDINWLTNPYGPRLVTDMSKEMVTAILAIRTNSGEQVWGWGGYYSGNKDAMHYEIVCSPAALRSGINPTTLPQVTPPPTPDPEENDMSTTAVYAQKDGTLRAAVIGPGNSLYHVVGTNDPMSLKTAGGTELPGKWKSISACTAPHNAQTDKEIIWGQGMDNGAYLVFWTPENGWQGPVRNDHLGLIP